MKNKTIKLFNIRTPLKEGEIFRVVGWSRLIAIGGETHKVTTFEKVGEMVNHFGVPHIKLKKGWIIEKQKVEKKTK
jgi:hypothetical protein